jgi:hypothetical protein
LQHITFIFLIIVIAMIQKDLILLLLICLTIISCRTPRFVYSPAPPNNPYFRERGESKLAAYYSTGADANELTNEYNNGFDLQGAYAVSDHFALTADYFKRSEKDGIYEDNRTYFDTSVVRYKRRLTSIGAGYYTPITNDRKITMNVYGGLGFGKYSFSDDGLDNGAGYHRDYSSDMTKWYIQPSINFFVGNYFRTGLISKVSWVRFNDIETSYTSAELSYLDLDRLPGRTLRFFEATWNVQVSFRNMNWFYLDGGFTFSSDPFVNDDTNLEARNFNASIGISLDLSKINRKNNEQ